MADRKGNHLTYSFTPGRPNLNQVRKRKARDTSTGTWTPTLHRKDSSLATNGVALTLILFVLFVAGRSP
jgi:hypothetical protein